MLCTALDPKPMATTSTHRARLERYYRWWCKEKLGNVDGILAACAGQEEAMFAKLVERYGPEPDPRDYRGRMVRLYTVYAPEKLGEVDALLPKFAGKEEAMFVTLVKKYGEEPDEPAVLAARAKQHAAPPSQVATPSAVPVGPLPHRERMVRFYTVY